MYQLQCFLIKVFLKDLSTSKLKENINTTGHFLSHNSKYFYHNLQSLGL